MNIIFMRHGEATDNVKKIISDKEIYWSTLTEDGKNIVLESISYLPKNIDKVYVSPLPRTIQTANMVYQEYPNLDFIIENRIREIYYGKYSGKENNEELDNIRQKQIAGDYFTRFGDYGENKYDIEYRLCDFLNDLYLNNEKSCTILIISHGSVMSYIKRIFNVKTQHINTGKIEIFNDIDFAPVFDHIEKLKNLKNDLN